MKKSAVLLGLVLLSLAFVSFSKAQRVNIKKSTLYTFSDFPAPEKGCLTCHKEHVWCE